jgi:hypothetical protein
MDLFIQASMKSLIKNLPERVEISKFETAITENQKAIITEYDDKIAVGFRAVIARRVFKMNGDGSISVTQSSETVGEYKFIPKKATLNDIVETINGIVDYISSTQFGEAE